MVDQSLLPLSDDLRYVICSRATLSSVASSQKVDPSCPSCGGRSIMLGTGGMLGGVLHRRVFYAHEL